jgi:hypothetical protein
MATWTRDEHLTFDIAFALKKVTIPGFRKALKEEDRIAIAATILEHLKLCRWEFSKNPNASSKVDCLWWKCSLSYRLLARNKRPQRAI